MNDLEVASVFNAMQLQVLRAVRQKLEVIWRVVELITVTVMNDLYPRQWPSQGTLHNQSMFKATGDDPIAMTANVPSLPTRGFISNTIGASTLPRDLQGGLVCLRVWCLPSFPLRVMPHKEPVEPALAYLRRLAAPAFAR